MRVGRADGQRLRLTQIAPTHLRQRLGIYHRGNAVHAHRERREATHAAARPIPIPLESPHIMGMLFGIEPRHVAHLSLRHGHLAAVEPQRQRTVHRHVRISERHRPGHPIAPQRIALHRAQRHVVIQRFGRHL